MFDLLMLKDLCIVSCPQVWVAIQCSLICVVSGMCSVVNSTNLWFLLCVFVCVTGTVPKEMQ